MFRTEINIPEATFKINHQTRLLTLGSCFSETMGRYFQENKFKTVVNPFGILYHPLSIVQLFNSDSILEEINFVERNGIWFNYQLHSKVFDTSKTALQEKIKKIKHELEEYISTCDVMLLTFGTAYYYLHSQPSFPVANCHKMPVSLFTKELSGKDDIVHPLTKAFNHIKKINNNIQIILTLSPVRHLKDTLTMNSLSKSLLRVVSHELSSSQQYIHYFPSFELMMDDLRDYRFYKEDMIHPSELAEKYIWEKFSNVFFSKSTKEVIHKYAIIQKGFRHKPFRSGTADHKNFVKDIMIKIEELSSFIPMEEEWKTAHGMLLQLDSFK